MKPTVQIDEFDEGGPDIIVADRFRLIRRIGEGAAGHVFEAEQLSLDRRVALKVLHAPNATRTDFRERFSREAKAVARLNHPNCITLHDFGYSEELDSLYMVMEYVEGRELFEIVTAADEPIPLRTSLRFAAQLAEALAHAHAAGIMHRDLKPENVLVTTDGQLKVLDFGLAKILDEISATEARRLTEQGAIFGTPQYMSPEQCSGDASVDARADIYSLGVMMYELFAGRLPFDSKDLIKVLVAQASAPPPPMPTDIPAELRELVMECLEKDREDRPQNAGIVVTRLQSFLVAHAVELGNLPDVSQEISRQLLKQSFPTDTPDPFRVSDHLDELPPEPTPTLADPPELRIDGASAESDDVVYTRAIHPAIWVIAAIVVVLLLVYLLAPLGSGPVEPSTDELQGAEVPPEASEPEKPNEVLRPPVDAGQPSDMDAADHGPSVEGQPAVEEPPVPKVRPKAATKPTKPPPTEAEPAEKPDKPDAVVEPPEEDVEPTKEKLPTLEFGL